MCSTLFKEPWLFLRRRRSFGGFLFRRRIFNEEWLFALLLQLRRGKGLFITHQRGQCEEEDVLSKESEKIEPGTERASSFSLAGSVSLKSDFSNHGPSR